LEHLPQRPIQEVHAPAVPLRERVFRSCPAGSAVSRPAIFHHAAIWIRQRCPQSCAKTARDETSIVFDTLLRGTEHKSGRPRSPQPKLIGVLRKHILYEAPVQAGAARSLLAYLRDVDAVVFGSLNLTHFVVFRFRVSFAAHLA